MDTQSTTQESADTLATSHVEEKTPESILSETGEKLEESPTQETKELSADEEQVAKEWLTLSGSTQDRIKQLLRERNEARAKAEQTYTAQVQADASRVAGPTADVGDDEIRKAVETLKTKGGMVTKDELYGMWNQVMQEREHDRLESKYSGSDGLPRYDREEVKDYMSRKQIWNPEAAFRDMYFDELSDRQRVDKRRKVITEKPSASATGHEEPITLETFREKLQGPEGRKVYEKLAKNPEKLEALIKQLTHA